MFSFYNPKTNEIVSCENWQTLARVKERSIAKGHIWQQLRYVAISYFNGRFHPMNLVKA